MHRIAHRVLEGRYGEANVKVVLRKPYKSELEFG